MKSADEFTGRRVKIIAFANGQKPVYYHESPGSYSEESDWILISVDDSTVFVLHR